MEVEIDETLALHATTLDEWVQRAEHWELTFRQGHDVGRRDNVEAQLFFTGLGHTCSASFRLDQVDSIQELADELWLILEEHDGTAKGIHSRRRDSTSSCTTSSGRRWAARRPSSPTWRRPAPR